MDYYKNFKQTYNSPQNKNTHAENRFKNTVITVNFPRW